MKTLINPDYVSLKIRKLDKDPEEKKYRIRISLKTEILIRIFYNKTPEKGPSGKKISYQNPSAKRK